MANMRSSQMQARGLTSENEARQKEICVKNVTNMIILAIAFVIVTPVVAQSMDQKVALFHGMTEQQKKVGLLVVLDYLKAQLKEESIKTKNPDELSRIMSIGAYTSVLQYELTNELGWKPLAAYHKIEARVTLGYLKGDLVFEEYEKHALKNKDFFDLVLSKDNIDPSKMKQVLKGRVKDMEEVGKMIYEESVRIADEAKAANRRKGSL